MARLVGMLARFLTCDQFEYPEGQRRLSAPDQHQRVQRELSPGGFCRQEENLVQFLSGPGFKQREKRADCLAYPGRRLRDQAAAEHGRFVHGLSQLPLASTK